VFLPLVVTSFVGCPLPLLRMHIAAALRPMIGVSHREMAVSSDHHGDGREELLLLATALPLSSSELKTWVPTWENGAPRAPRDSLIEHLPLRPLIAGGALLAHEIFCQVAIILRNALHGLLHPAQFEEAVATVSALHASDSSNIYKCFQDLGIAEALDSENTWKCPRCSEKVLAQKSLELWDLPDVLVLHFKRFK
jgi:DNA-directed RNA polymerase subunit RPC12/RpoP